MGDEKAHAERRTPRIVVFAAILVAISSLIYIGEHVAGWISLVDGHFNEQRAAEVRRKEIISDAMTAKCRAKYGSSYYASETKDQCCGAAAGGEFCQPKVW